MISAVDLLKGIAVGAGMKNISVEGANGGLHTNYLGKAQAAVDAVLKDGYDFAYIHVEAPDEMGHQGSVERKIQSIEYLDEQVVKPVYEQMLASGEAFRLLVLPDHPTPIRVRTHTSDPVPYLLFDSTGAAAGILEIQRAGSESERKLYGKRARDDAVSSGCQLTKQQEFRNAWISIKTCGGAWRRRLADRGGGKTDR